MYFSTTHGGNQQAAKIVALSAKAFGVKLSAPALAHVPFESVVAAIAKAKGISPDQVVKEVTQLERPNREKALSVGMAEIVKGFGGENNAMDFFRQILDPRNTIRFESVGGVSHDLRSVKNQLQVAAADAYLVRQASEADGILPAEREYIELMKSVRRNLEIAVEEGSVAPDVGEKMVSDIESAVARVSLPSMGVYVKPLHDAARLELFDEALERVRRRYASVPSQDGPELS